MLAVGAALALSAAGSVPTSAAGSGKPAAPAAAGAGVGTRSVPAGATACRSTKAKPSSTFASCAGVSPAVAQGAAIAAAAATPTIILTATHTAMLPGGSTTLTASANEDVGPTPFFIEIFDLTAGTLLSECGFGSSCSSSVTQTSAVHGYVAYISSFGTTFPPPNIQAAATPLLISWLSVSLTASATSLTSGGATTVTATTSTDVGPTPLWTQIFDLTGNTQVAICRAERLQVELDAVTSELTRGTGLGGRARSFAGPEERARTAVRKAIRRALDEIEAADAEIGRALRASVRTGYVCRYAPLPAR